jgi:hypothetical protein
MAAPQAGRDRKGGSGGRARTGTTPGRQGTARGGRRTGCANGASGFSAVVPHDRVLWISCTSPHPVDNRRAAGDRAWTGRRSPINGAVPAECRPNHRVPWIPGPSVAHFARPLPVTPRLAALQVVKLR